MFSAIVVVPPLFTPHHRMHEAVARTLSALVPAAIADVVSDAMIAAPSQFQLTEIAEAAGCRLITETTPSAVMRQAAIQAQRNYVFFVLAGFAPGAGFIDELSDFLNEGRQPAALKRAPARFYERMFPAMSQTVGLAAARSACADIHAETIAGYAKSLRAKPLWTSARRVI